MKKLLTLFIMLISANMLISQTPYFERVSITEQLILNKTLEVRSVMAPPVNDNCASATVLTIGNPLVCGQTTDQATLQGSECYTNYGGGSTEVSTWYRITSTNDSLILNFMLTNTPNCYPHIRVYGPFASGAGCLPACGSAIYSVLQNGDPGSHILLTGLASAGNSDYLIQIQGNECGGPGSSFTTFCINVANPASNSYSTGSNNLNACGTSFGGSTNGGYFQNGTSVGFNNLDGNAGTTCTACPAGDDTPFIINNVSWFNFCSATAGTWQVTVNGVGGCINTAPNNGVQASLFTGIPTALVNQGNSQNPIPIAGTWTSGTITVNAGECAYLMIDGFAGDACNYSVTLTNITGGCIVLPIELLYFNGVKQSCSQNILTWATATEINNDRFEIERSLNGVDFDKIATINGNGNSTSTILYSLVDANPPSTLNYYRLKQIDYNGVYSNSGIIVIDNSCISNLRIIRITNLLGQEINSDYKGPRFIHYNDNTVVKKIGI